MQQLTCGDLAVGSGFIVGGSTTKRGQLPFVSSLFRTDNDQYFCRGTIITRRHVITAAHCMQSKYWDKVLQTNELVAFLRRYNISKRFETDAGLSKVDQIIMHPNCNNEATDYDADQALLSAGDNTKYEKAESIERNLNCSRSPMSTDCFLHELNSQLCLQTARFVLEANLSFYLVRCARENFNVFHVLGHVTVIRVEVSLPRLGQTGYCVKSSQLLSSTTMENVMLSTKYAVYTNVVKHTNWVNGIITRTFESRRLVYESVDPNGRKGSNVCSQN